jgi:hypothetical protein
MDQNLYALEMQARARLTDARALAARVRLLDSLRGDHGARFSIRMLRDVLRAGRRDLGRAPAGATGA